MATSQITYRTSYTKYGKSAFNQTGSGFIEGGTSAQ
jgi:hypothetical protein